jgi:hypothetical protein
VPARGPRRRRRGGARGCRRRASSAAPAVPSPGDSPRLWRSRGLVCACASPPRGRCRRPPRPAAPGSRCPVGPGSARADPCPPRRARPLRWGVCLGVRGGRGRVGASPRGQRGSLAAVGRACPGSRARRSAPPGAVWARPRLRPGPATDRRPKGPGIGLALCCRHGSRPPAPNPCCGRVDRPQGRISPGAARRREARRMVPANGPPPRGDGAAAPRGRRVGRGRPLPRWGRAPLHEAGARRRPGPVCPQPGRGGDWCAAGQHDRVRGDPPAAGGRGSYGFRGEGSVSRAHRRL